MIIIIEGPDGVGKTTLAHRIMSLAHRQGISRYPRLLHRGPPEKHPFVEYELNLLDEPTPWDLLVCDRWHWGELIYAPLYRNGSLLGPAGRLHVDAFLAKYDGVLVYTRDNEQDVTSRLSRRGEDYLLEKDIGHVIGEYERLYESLYVPEQKTPLPAMRVNPVQEQDAEWRILDFASKHASRAPTLALHDLETYIGPVDPKIIFFLDDRDQIPRQPIGLLNDRLRELQFFADVDATYGQWTRSFGYVGIEDFIKTSPWCEVRYAVAVGKYAENLFLTHQLNNMFELLTAKNIPKVMTWR